jgi:hypothetical protein
MSERNEFEFAKKAACEAVEITKAVASAMAPTANRILFIRAESQKLAASPLRCFPVAINHSILSVY